MGATSAAVPAPGVEPREATAPRLIGNRVEELLSTDPRPALRHEVIRHLDGLTALGAEWLSLFFVAGRVPLHLHPAWVEASWHAFASDPSWGVELVAVAVRDGASLVGLAVLHLGPPRGGALRARILRLPGDGLLGADRPFLAAPGYTAAVAASLANVFAAEPAWDVLDLTAGVGDEVTGLGPAIAMAFEDTGRVVERTDVLGRPVVSLGPDFEAFSERQRLSPSTLAELASLADLALVAPHAMAEGLRHLERLLAVAPDELLPPPGALLAFLSCALPALTEAGLGGLYLYPDPSGGLEPRAAVVLVHDGTRVVELLRAAHHAPDAERLTLLGARMASRAGADRFELSLASPLVSVPARGHRIRVYSRNGGGVLQRGYASLVSAASSLTDAARAPRGTITRIRDASLGELASGAVTRVVARVATFSRMHLYRGELFVRRAPVSTPASIRLYSLAEFESASPELRATLARRLELDLDRALADFRRGDLAVLATQGEVPVGVLWCARGPVDVPEIGRKVRMLPTECYVHDAFVAPEARGQKVAPAMLDFVARELRGRDVYRAWALIERTNTASTRAFEKAGYASIADVIYARMGRASKLLVRPPDAYARAFLGLSAR